MTKNTSSKGDQIRLKKSSRWHMIMNISLSLAKPIGEYCAIIAISRHRKKTGTEPKPRLVLPQVARVINIIRHFNIIYINMHCTLTQIAASVHVNGV